MALKEKVIGLIMILVGALPFLLKIEKIGALVGGYTWLLPGEYLYQAILIVIGLILLIRIRPKIEFGK